MCIIYIVYTYFRDKLCIVYVCFIEKLSIILELSRSKSSTDKFWRWGGMGWSSFLRSQFSECSTPLWGGAWGGVFRAIFWCGVEWGGVFWLKIFRVLHPTVGWSKIGAPPHDGVEWGGLSTPYEKRLRRP